MSTASRGSCAGRVKPLDGLRGVAAAVVVITHIGLTGALANAVLSGTSESRTSRAALLGYTPLHFFWDGTFAVYVFFGLSGYVLTLQMGGNSRKSWREYYSHRLLRLYLPVWSAVVFAGLLAASVPRVIPADGSLWLQAHAGTGFTHGSFSAAALLTSSSVPWLDSPLWSLKWEVIFSLLLPLYLMVGRRLGFRSAMTSTVTLLAIEVSAFHGGPDSAIFMPMFAVGALLAFQRERIGRITGQFDTTTWIAVGLLAVLAQSAYWIEVGWGTTAARLAVAKGLQVLSVALLLVIATGCDGSQRVLTSRSLQWLGKRSFSLYLTHEPIVVSAAILLGPHPIRVFVVAMPLSLLVAELFGRLVEVPCNRLAAYVGKRAAHHPLLSGSRLDQGVGKPALVRIYGAR